MPLYLFRLGLETYEIRFVPDHQPFLKVSSWHCILVFYVNTEPDALGMCCSSGRRVSDEKQFIALASITSDAEMPFQTLLSWKDPQTKKRAKLPK